VSLIFSNRNSVYFIWNNSYSLCQHLERVEELKLNLCLQQQTNAYSERQIMQVCRVHKQLTMLIYLTC